jgi:heme-degrading monooxygenase HmoA
MAYARMSSIRFNKDTVEEGGRLMKEMLEECRGHQGFITGFLLRASSDPNRISRMTFWRSNHDADLTAQSTHVQALRARLNVLAENSEHLELGYDFLGDPAMLERAAG